MIDLPKKYKEKVMNFKSLKEAKELFFDILKIFIKKAKNTCYNTQ